MKNQIVKAIGGILAILALAVFTQVCVSAQSRSTATPQKTESRRDQGLAGSWDVTTMIRDCESGTVFVSFPAMMTYHQGGTMQEAANDAAPLLRRRAREFGSSRQDGRIQGHSTSSVTTPTDHSLAWVK